MPHTFARARFSAEIPHNALPQLPPKAELETKAVMKALVRARAALAELKQAGELIPNQSILINTLPVLEARASSEIENIVTTADRLFRFAQHDESERADPATKEALRYQSALMQGLRALAKKPVTTCMAVENIFRRPRRASGAGVHLRLVRKSPKNSRRDFAHLGH